MAGARCCVNVARRQFGHRGGGFVGCLVGWTGQHGESKSIPTVAGLAAWEGCHFQLSGEDLHFPSQVRSRGRSAWRRASALLTHIDD